MKRNGLDARGTVISPSKRHIILVNAGSGAGKTAAVNYWHERHGVPAVVKFSDRRPRSGASAGPGEPLCIAPADFTRLAARSGFYEYAYGGRRYGFSRHDIENLFTVSSVVSVIVADHAVIRQVQWDFAGLAEVVPVFINTDHNVLLRRLRSAGYPEVEIQARVSRSASIMAAFEAEPDLYRVVIDNNRDWDWFETQLCAVAEQLLPAGIQEVAA
jgi:guanylate kinase